ncbi:MAG: NrsF family protein [Beijerinckiaceae bacterium]|jgi:hypothetical protein
MSETAAKTNQELDSFVNGLVADLRPVKPLLSPWLRALIWLGLVAIVALGLVSFADLSAFRARMMGAPDMWLAVVGSALTAALAVVAALEVDLPDRSRAWGLLPLPGLALWIGASGLGCARNWLIPGTHEASLADTKDCLAFILGLSIPLSAVLLVMLRRGYSLAPNLTGALAGLAVAAAAATLLTLFHPYDAAVTDLAVHAAAVALVIIANRFLAGRILGR